MASADKLAKILSKLKRCYHCHTLLSLEECLNEVGMTVQHTPQNCVILCKLKGGKPQATDVLEDYMFVGSLVDKGVEFSQRIQDAIVDFVQTNAGAAGKVKYGKVWHDGVQLYDRAVVIVSEDKSQMAQEMVLYDTSSRRLILG